ncbi:MAG: 4Fe-4S ferredoxin, partial [Deltaproteobacteria bacterium]|nr:4Fe-4S ferredoxin [Deltaproteobacteria bacterium]
TPEEEKALSEAEARGESVKRPAAPKNPASWTYDFTHCSLCACCIESCPVKSIRFSNEMYIAGTSRSDFHYDLLARLKRLAKKAPAKQEDKSSQNAANAQSEARI